MGNFDFIVGCVGKPSAGKSTFFNASTATGNAKVGNFPFTTIKPNEGIAYYFTKCPCIYGCDGTVIDEKLKEDEKKKTEYKCQPTYGKCSNGMRSIPVKLLDVAGLVPGAHEGRGLGNQFLDDLRHAHVLIHVIDVSGTTNQIGEKTIGYDPTFDHRWLLEEINLWIFDNVWKKWNQIARKHHVTKSTLVKTLQGQLSGYGADQALIVKLVSELQKNINPDLPPFDDNLNLWTKENVQEMVTAFVNLRFPFVLLLNKCDMEGDTDGNVMRISQTFPNAPVVLCSALAECFLQKMRDQKYICYDEGDTTFYTLDEKNDIFLNEHLKKKIEILKQIDEKNKLRLEKMKDMVLFRYGSTGVHEAIRVAVERLGKRIPVFPTKSFSQGHKGKSAFRECLLIPENTTVRQLAMILHPALERNLLYAESHDGRRIADNEIITRSNNVIKLITEKVI